LPWNVAGGYRFPLKEMVIFDFTLEDLARTRFAISPMWELVSGLRALRDPARAAHHLPWVAEALPLARGLELETALALTPADGYIPDFLTPPPSTPLASFDDELELVRATPAARIRGDIATFAAEQRRVRRAPLERLREHPRRELARLCDALAEVWALVLAPHWERVRSVLEADLLHRSRRLTDGGPARLFEDLHPAVRWHDRRLEVDQVYDAQVSLGGEGVLLVPSAFQAVGPASISQAPWQPTLIYPARGLALLWAPGAAEAPGALAAVIGETRARLLEALEAPRSTTELARRLALTPGAVSKHLSALHAAGLATATRHGRSVLYLRTPVAEQLLRAPTAVAAERG
jgi:DNA-binding transcriptional ArsR family regulator